MSATSKTDSSDDHSLEELERALATRPKRRLTPEEKVARRRLQYKLHQRRHRAKQKDKTFELEKEVCQLMETVARLQRDRRALLQSQHVFQSRGVVGGAPAKVAMEYLRLFEFGYAAKRSREQEQFVRAVMVENIGGPDYQGVDALLHQWRLYSSFFLMTQYVPDVVDVSTIGELTAVVIDVVLTIRPRREGVMCLCPNVRDDEEVIQEMVGNAIDVPGKLRFVFDSEGACTWFGTDMDFVTGLQRTLGSLKKVAACMEGAHISFGTGQISLACQVELAEATARARHDLTYIRV